LSGFTLSYGKLNSDGSAGAFIGSISSYAGSFVGPEEEPSLKAGYSNEQSSKNRQNDADPDAAPFYRRMGAYDVGEAPSGSGGVNRRDRPTADL
jgi:hypothetical protein